MVSRYRGPSIRGAFAPRSWCARSPGAATASSDCSSSAWLEVASSLGQPGRTSPPTSCTSSATSWPTRLTIAGSWSCWRVKWGTACPRPSPPGSGNGPSEDENERVSWPGAGLRWSRQEQRPTWRGCALRDAALRSRHETSSLLRGDEPRRVCRGPEWRERLDPDGPGHRLRGLDELVRHDPDGPEDLRCGTPARRRTRDAGHR